MAGFPIHTDSDAEIERAMAAMPLAPPQNAEQVQESNSGNTAAYNASADNSRIEAGNIDRLDRILRPNLRPIRNFSNIPSPIHTSSREHSHVEIEPRSQNHTYVEIDPPRPDIENQYPNNRLTAGRRPRRQPLATLPSGPEPVHIRQCASSSSTANLRHDIRKLKNKRYSIMIIAQAVLVVLTSTILTFIIHYNVPVITASAAVIFSNTARIQMGPNNLMEFEGTLMLPKIQIRNGSELITVQIDNENFETNKNDTESRPNNEGKIYTHPITGEKVERFLYNFNYIYYKSKILNIGNRDPNLYMYDNHHFLETHGYSSNPADYIISKTYAIHVEHTNYPLQQFEKNKPKPAHVIKDELLSKTYNKTRERRHAQLSGLTAEIAKYIRKPLITTPKPIEITTTIEDNPYVREFNKAREIGKNGHVKLDKNIRLIKNSSGTFEDKKPIYYVAYDSRIENAHLELNQIRKLQEFNPTYRENEEKLLIRKRQQRDVKLEDEKDYLSKYTEYTQNADIKNALSQILSPNEIEAIISRNDRHYLIGFDCSQPMEQPQPTSSFMQSLCDEQHHGNDNIDELPNPSSYQILQQEDDRRIDGYACHITMTKTVVMCGNYDFQTALSSENFYNEPITITPQECNRMAKESQWIDTIGRPHDTPLGTTTRISYYEAGKEYATYPGQPNNHIECEGGETRVNNQLFKSMVVHKIYHVRIRKEIIIQRADKSLIASHSNVRLPCSLSDESCEAGITQFIWPKPADDYCPMMVARQTVYGVEVTANGGKDRVFMSKDNTGVRLSLGAKTIHCGKTVYTSSYPGIFLYNLYDDDGQPRPNVFKRQIQPHTTKLHLWITAREDAMFHEITESLRKEFAVARSMDCSKKAKLSKIEHWLERNNPSFHTFSFMGNNFLTTSGEVTYNYACNPTLVQAINAKQCYDALPVVEVTRRKETINFTYIDSMPGTTMDPENVAIQPELFLEPITHKLTKVASVIPCTQGLYSMYKDVLGRWFQITPLVDKLDRAPQERKITSLAHIKTYNVSFRDSTNRGIYSFQALDDMHSYMEFPRIRDALVHRMAGQTENLKPGQYLYPKAIFPDSLPNFSWSDMVLGKLWGFLHKAGETTAIALFIYYAFRWIFLGWKIFVSCEHFSRLYGCSIQLCWSFCPGQHYSREVKASQKTILQKAERENELIYGNEANFKTLIPLSSYKSNTRAIIKDYEYNMIPKQPCNDEIILGTLQYHFDKKYGRIPTVRDSYLASLPSAPNVIDDIDPKLRSDSTSNLYPILTEPSRKPDMYTENPEEYFTKMPNDAILPTATVTRAIKPPSAYR